MKKLIILSAYFILLSFILIGQPPIYNYINARAVFSRLDTLREKNEYEEIFKILNHMDVNSIPKDYTTSYYAKFSEYYLNCISYNFFPLNY